MLQTPQHNAPEKTELPVSAGKSIYGPICVSKGGGECWRKSGGRFTGSCLLWWFCLGTHRLPSGHLTRCHRCRAGTSPWRCPAVSETLETFCSQDHRGESEENITTHIFNFQQNMFMHEQPHWTRPHKCHSSIQLDGRIISVKQLFTNYPESLPFRSSTCLWHCSAQKADIYSIQSKE